ncbi:MAG: carbohydrate binding domain-containing protein, partial [Patescibacteria group bacterium]|nr:carbohydrate binding domain-containing protein [Patescibacteria group bacterium]
GNTILCDEANKSKYGIYSSISDNDYNTITNNTIIGPVTAAIYAQGPHTTVAGNKTSSATEGLFDIQSQTGATQDNVKITNAGTGNSLSIDQNGNTGATITTDGALFIENTGNTGIGLNAYTNVGAAAGGLVYFTADNTAFDQTVLTIQQDGTGDIINVFDGATEVFTILDGGNVGIGTPLPASKLDVLGTLSSTTAGSTYTASKSATTITATVGTFTSADIGRFFVWTDGTVDTITAYTDATHVTVANSATISSQTGYTRTSNFYVDASGNVGIGTTNKLSKLTVKQSADEINIVGTTTANASTTITGSGTTFTTDLGVGDRISLSSASSTYATVTAIASDTSLTIDTALGDGTSQTINAKHSIFRLDDSSDAVKMVVNDQGNVGIGTTNPAYNLDIQNDGLNAIVFTTAYGTSMAGSFYGASARGTQALPTASQLDDYLGVFGARGYGATGFSAWSKVAIFMNAAENWTDTAQGTYIGFNTTAIGGTSRTEKLRITDSGEIGIGTPLPASKLDVLGTLSSTTAGSTYTASKSATTITATVGTFTSADIGRFFVWTDGTVDTITAYTDATHVTVANSATISSQTGYTRTSNFYVDASGNIGVGTVNPTAKLHISESATTSALIVTQASTGNIVDLQSLGTSIFTLVNEDRLTLENTLLTTIGVLNDNLIDDMESAADTEWTESDGVNTAVATETTQVKVNDGSMKITTVAGSSNTDTLQKTITSEDWSSTDQIGFWIKATQTGQIISIQFKDSVAVAEDHNIIIKNANQWQYEQWDISGITSTSRDIISWIQFIIDDDTSSPIFYIDQLRRYNNSSATNRMAEYFVDADGTLVMFGDKGVELGRSIPGSNLPSMKIGSATVQINNPLDLQVEGDVGVEYNLEFLNNGTSYINSAGPLSIVAGDSNSFENLTLTTGNTGDVIIDIADSTNGFRIVGIGGGVFSVDTSGNVVIGGVNATDSDLTVKRNIATQGGNLTLNQLSTPANITVTPVGTAGSTTYGYRISALNGNGETLASATATTTTGNATLSVSNYNRVLWDAVTGATSYKIYGRTSGSELYMATINSPTLSYNDDGTVVTPAGALPTVNTTGGDITGILSFSNATNLTLSSNAITVTQTYHTVDEEGTAIDDIDTINGGAEGDLLVIRGFDIDYLVTAKDGTGNLELAGDFALTDPNDALVLMYDGGDWIEVSRTTNGADVSESYYVNDLSTEAGDLVSVSNTNGNVKLEDRKNYFVQKSVVQYDSGLMGIVSTSPFVTMGGGYGKLVNENEEIWAETRSVALAGRVPAKVNLENGEIEIGDFLTSSSVPGVAMKATGTGRVVGRALEPFDGNVTSCSVEIVEMKEKEDKENNNKSDKKEKRETLRMINCQKIPSETGKVMTFIDLGWQGNSNQQQDVQKDWIEMNGWCVSIDDNGDWKQIKKTATTCAESENNSSVVGEVSNTFPVEPKVVPEEIIVPEKVEEEVIEEDL